MFYSHTFLARKGPLSTVWIAAHLQHRLKKSHYTSTNISSTVQHIMDPGVPIALRMSAFLLLGVVRIYSKKVDYLYLDCNAVRMSFYKDPVRPSNTVPEDARQAPVESITMPETFHLDALKLDFEMDYNGIEDIHQRSIEEITLRDQTPIPMDDYVTITFDEEDMILDSSSIEAPPDHEAIPIEEDIIPQSPLTNTVGVQYGGLSVPIESPTTHPQSFQDPEAIDGSPPQVTFENLCDVEDHIVIDNPPYLGNENTEPNRDIDQIVIEKDQIPITDEVMFEGSPQQPFRPLTPVTSQGGASEPQVFEGGESHHLASSPIRQPQRRGRKRKQFFDEPIVLTNRCMRGALNNPHDILRKRRNVAHSTLGTWKANNSRIKEQIFYRPLLTGLCNDLLDITKREYICSRPHLVISEEDHVDAGVNRIPSPTNGMSNEPRAATPPMTTPDMEIQQHLSLNQMSNEPRAATPPLTAAPDMEIQMHLSIDATALPTMPAQNVGVELNIEGDCRSPNRVDDHVSPTSAENVHAPYLATSPGARGPEIETPSTYWNDTIQNSGFPDTHQLINSTEKEELDFLLMENNTPASSQGTSTSVGTLSERTRSVAEYLKRHSPITPILEDPTVSLNNILEGKTRKISARMFFEVLVLKNHGLINVEQKVTFGDVTLNLTPMLSNSQI